MSLLKWAGIMAVLAILTAVLGFGGLAGAFVNIAQILFFLFLTGVVISGILGFIAYRKVERAL